MASLRSLTTASPLHFFLKYQIKNYAIELSHKNEQITSLIKLVDKNINKGNVLMETMPDRQRQSLNEAKHVECDNDSGLKEMDNNSIKSNNYINESIDDTNSNIPVEERNTFQPDDWITVRKKKHGNDIQLRNRFTSLNYKCVEHDDIKNDVIDLYDGDNELRNTHLQPTAHTDKPKSNVYLNSFPERDVQHYNKRTDPGSIFATGDHFNATCFFHLCYLTNSYRKVSCLFNRDSKEFSKVKIKAL